MNEVHLQLCSSAEWGDYVEQEMLPWVLGDRSLGDDVLEVGPGPGLTTNILSRLVPRLTAAEIDEELAAALRERLAGSNVTVVHADATRLPFESGRFSAAISLTMLHHVPTPEAQDELFAEVARVLAPGGLIIGADSQDSASFRELHVDDVCNPIDPDTLPERLVAAGFIRPRVEAQSQGDLGRFRFCAERPA
jgi:SAM-dependent methyltransferase